MPWVTFRGYQRLAFERNLERRNNQARRKRGLQPVKRKKATHPPQAPPSSVTKE